MINVYRDYPNVIEISNKKRSSLKTFYWKFLIKLKGVWKKRFTRCIYCSKVFDHERCSINVNYLSHLRFKCSGGLNSIVCVMSEKQLKALKAKIAKKIIWRKSG